MSHLRPFRTFSTRLGTVATLAFCAAACLATGSGGAELQSRYATVHNALSAIGMSETGALHEVRVGAGQEGDVPLDLASGCTTVVAVGAASIGDLDAALTDAAGTRVARGTGHTSEATIRACNDSAATFTLRLKAARGGGSVLVSTWAGGTPVDPAVANRGGEVTRAFGTCDEPIPLSAGDYSGTTAHAQHQNESKGCGSSAGKELVYRLELAARQKVLVAVETPTFDGVIYIRKAECTESEAEVACNDDAPAPGATEKDQKHSRIEQVLDEGTYFVFVDALNTGGPTHGAGSFRMHVELADAAPLAELCSKAPLLADGVSTSGTTDGSFDSVDASCGTDAHGPDSVYTLAVARRSRVRVVLHSEDYAPVVHVRSRCEDAQSAIGCADTGGADHDATFLSILDAGSYAVFADSSQREANGKFTLTAETTAEAGSGVRGERCRDAIPLVKAEPSVSGDTFAARDDVTSKCGGAGAPDQIYRLDLPARAHFTARITREEATHQLALLRGCDGSNMEVDCGKAIDRVLPAGSYFLAVDGDSPASFGTYTLEWATHDTHAQDSACRAPARLREGESINGTTLGGAVDKFTPSCATSDSSAGGAPDVVYELVLPARRRVGLRLHTTGWAGVISVRHTCLEGDTAAMAASEVGCQAEDGADAEFDSVVEAGTYYVVIDGKEPGSAGTFSLEYLRAH